MKYAKVLQQFGGPIERVETATGMLMGLPCMQAVAYLRQGLVPDSIRSNTITKQPDGAGSHQSAQIACHMAISEALERWAVYHCRALNQAGVAGLGYDRSSNGFAAFPGLFKRQARKAAFRESIERHCLISWWEGLLGHSFLRDPRPGVRAIRINNPFSQHTVVVLWAMHGHRHSYSFGAGTDLNHAIWRAMVELRRTQSVIDNLGKSSLEEVIGNLFERRIAYFSTATGMCQFLQRLEVTVSNASSASLELLFDASIPGPWSRYASVWRTVVEAPCQDYLSDTEDYFFW